MKQLAKKAFRRLPAPLQERIRGLLGTRPAVAGEGLPYRAVLFEELQALAGAGHFRDGRILEIGPKDGLDSRRLAGLSPRELVLIDLPEKREGNEQWLSGIACPKRYLEANLLYMPKEQIEALEKFRLIYCTGVLYHNAEQMRLLRRLYRMLEIGGYLVLETATLRGAGALRRGAYVQIHYPDTYRNTGTVTHLPSAGAVRAWLAMVGFREVHDSDCYRSHNRDLIGQRYACICRKNADDESDGYYQKSGLNPKYPFGDSA